MARTSISTPEAKGAGSPSHPPAWLNWWNVVIMLLITFLAGLFVGAFILGPYTSFSKPQGATSSLPGLPPGHPPIDSATSQSPDPSSSPTNQTDRSILFYDDPVIRKRIEESNNYEELVQIGNQQFDADHALLAVAAYEKALKINPKDPDVRTDLGIMYRKLGRFQDALREFRTAATLDPRHTQSRYNIGVVLHSDLGDIPGSIKAWEEYLKVAPNDEQAQKVRQQVEQMKKMLEKM